MVARYEIACCAELVDIRIAHIPPIATHRPNIRQPHQISKQTRNPTRKTCAYHFTSSSKSAAGKPNPASTPPNIQANTQPNPQNLRLSPDSSSKSATEPPKLASTPPVGAAYAQPGCAYAPKKEEYTQLIHRKADRAGCRYYGGARWRCGYRSPSCWKNHAPVAAEYGTG